MKKSIFYSVLAGLLIVSCAKTEQDLSPKPEQPEVEQNTVPVTFKAITENGAKTTIDIAGTEGTVSWAAGDDVKFIYEVDKTPGAVTSAALATSDIDAGIATFTGEFPAGIAGTFAKAEADFTGTSRHLYAVYPASVVHDYSNASTLYVTVPSTQDGSFAGAAISLAKWDKYHPTAALQFDNLCGLLQFTVADAAVRSVVISSDATLAGKACVTFTAAGTDGKPTVKGAVQDPVYSITVNVSGAGTYYAAILPTDISNLYIALYDAPDAGGNLLGDTMSGNTVSVARKHIRPLGTLATGFPDRLYFTPAGQGTKDGSSWTNAGDVALLKTTMQSAATKNLFLAAGDYNLGNTGCTAVSNFKIFGGYPDGLSGNAISGRDVANNITTLMNVDKSRNFYINNGSANWLFDGISFLCTNYSGGNGGAFSLLGGTATLNNCTFDGCSNIKTGTAGGVIRIESGTTATFKGCTFSNNTASALGGVFLVNGAATLSLKESTFAGNSAGNNGGAIYIAGSPTMTIDGCTFSGNSSGNLGGAIHFQSNTGNNCVIRNCTFSGNSTTTASPGDNTGHGSAISAAGTGGGVITVEKSTFSGNTAAHCGAIFVRANPFRFIDCDFLDNATSNADYHGSSIFIDRTYPAYFERCYFSYTSASCDTDGKFTGKGITVCVGIGSQASVAGFNNCVFAGSWGNGSVQQLMVDGASAKATIVNSTFFDQTSGGNLRLKQGTLNVINSIIVNAASSGAGGTNGSVNGTAGMTLNMDYTWYTKTNAAATENINNSLAGVQVYLDANANTNFANGWYKTNALTMYGDNQTKTQTANGWTTHYYEWSNLPTATGIDSYTYPSLTTVGGLVNTADADFYTWLNTNGYLGKDIRGVSRNSSAMWPGSYENQ